MDPDETVRITVIKALQSIGDVGAVAPLVVVLAHEQVRHKSTGRSSLAVERAAATALDALCDESAVESLETALKHDDADVREIAVRRLARIASPRVIDPLVTSLQDEDPVIRRAAARGLAEIQCRRRPTRRAFATTRHCGSGAAARVRRSRPADASVFVRPRRPAGTIRHHRGAGPAEMEADRGRLDDRLFLGGAGPLDKCTELGEPAVEALDGILRSAPKWRDRAGAAATLAGMDQPRSAPFTNLDLVQRSLAILDGKAPTRTSAVFSKP